MHSCYTMSMPLLSQTACIGRHDSGRHLAKAKSSELAALGHAEAFPAVRRNGRCRFSQGTLAGTRGNGRDAPIPVVCETTIEPASATLLTAPPVPFIEPFS